MSTLSPPTLHRTPAEMTCVCCNCHRQRTEANEWQEHCPVAGERVTHGICPACVYELYPDIAVLVLSGDDRA